MKIDLPVGTRCCERCLNLAMPNLLLDPNDPEVRRDVLVNFETKRFPDPQARGPAQNDERAFPRLLPGRQCFALSESIIASVTRSTPA